MTSVDDEKSNKRDVKKRVGFSRFLKNAHLFLENCSGSRFLDETFWQTDLQFLTKRYAPLLYIDALLIWEFKSYPSYPCNDFS